MITQENFKILLQMMGEEKQLPEVHSEKGNTDNNTMSEIKFLLEKIWYTLEIATKDTLSHPLAARFLEKSTSELYQIASRKDIIYTKPGGKANYYSKVELEKYKQRNPQK